MAKIDTILPKMVPVELPGALRMKDITEDTELYIFRIPKGLMQLKDLVNKEITIGSKKCSKIKLNGKNLEFVTRSLEGQDLTPWVPNSKGVLKQVTAPIVGEVSVRICLNKPRQLDLSNFKAPAEHTPPDLPVRDFFGANFGNNFHRNDSQSTGFQPSPVKCQSVSAVKSDIVKTEKSDHANSVPVKNKRMSLEELTPQLQQKPFRKKKQDKLVSEFKNVFNDICKSPDVKLGKSHDSLVGGDNDDESKPVISHKSKKQKRESGGGDSNISSSLLEFAKKNKKKRKKAKTEDSSETSYSSHVEKRIKKESTSS